MIRGETDTCKRILHSLVESFRQCHLIALIITNCGLLTISDVTAIHYGAFILSNYLQSDNFESDFSIVSSLVDDNEDPLTFQGPTHHMPYEYIKRREQTVSNGQQWSAN